MKKSVSFSDTSVDSLRSLTPKKNILRKDYNDKDVNTIVNTAPGMKEELERHIYDMIVTDYNEHKRTIPYAGADKNIITKKLFDEYITNVKVHARIVTYVEQMLKREQLDYRGELDTNQLDLYFPEYAYVDSSGRRINGMPPTNSARRNTYNTPSKEDILYRKS